MSEKVAMLGGGHENKDQQRKERRGERFGFYSLGNYIGIPLICLCVFFMEVGSVGIYQLNNFDLL